MSTIISEDTTWSAGSTITLTDDIQIAPGVTLTIEPGAIIEGDQYSITVFGTLDASGSSIEPILFHDAYVFLSTSSSAEGFIAFDYVQIEGGALLASTGYGMYGAFEIRHSVISSSSYSDIWYPSGDSIIDLTVFINSLGVSVGTSSGLFTFSDNLVWNEVPIDGFSALQVWASYNGPVSIVDNAFLSPDSLGLRLSLGGYVSGSGNYFGTSDASAIAQTIYDRSDDLNVDHYVDPAIISLTPASTLPTSIFSFFDLTLPPEIIYEGRLAGSADISITGNDLSNLLVGNDGSNTLDGGIGADTMTGGDGDDVFIVDDPNDVLFEDTDGGTDLVLSSVSYSLGANLENLTLTGSDEIDGDGNSLANMITGNDAANILTGGPDNDTLIGSGGDDTLDGGAGADLMEGGSGDDRYVVDDPGDVVSEEPGAGNDTVLSSISYTLGSDVENLTLTGTGSIDATGNAFANVITGNSGMYNDLSGGGGDDILIGTGTSLNELNGNSGDDIIYGSSSTDFIMVNTHDGEDPGHDTVYGGNGDDTLWYQRLDLGSEPIIFDARPDNTGFGYTSDGTIFTEIERFSVSTWDGNDVIYTLDGNDTINSSNGDDCISSAGGDDSISGGFGNDTIYAGSGADIISGDLSTINTQFDSSDVIYAGAGNDVVHARGGNDKVYGGADSDELYGDDGDDLIDGGTGSDVMFGGVGNDTFLVDSIGDAISEDPEQGTDLVSSSVSHTLSAHLENLTLTGSESIDGTGNVLDNILTGNDSENLLSGLAGNDTLTGGAGNDTLDGGEGVDTASYAEAAGAMVVNLTTGKSTGDGSDKFSAIENVVGSAFDDKLLGNAEANGLSGGSGTDMLFGLGGDDTLDGGAGSDTASYAYATGSVIVDLATGTATGDGNDTLISIENVSGSSFDDVIAGDSGANVLNGASGTDTATYSGSAAGITANLTNGMANGDGTDRLVSIENLTGSSFDDKLLGNGSANVLSGGGGNDILFGLGGDDTLDGGEGSDTANYAYALAGVTVNLTNGIATGDGTDELADIENVTGSGFDDKLLGDTGANTLSGAGGDDTLFGLAGDDRLEGGAGNDTASYNYAIAGVTANLTNGTATGDGTDTLVSIENLTGSSFDDRLLGNSLANMLAGGAGDDMLFGLGGDDTLQGGAGTDTANYNYAAQGVTVNLTSGTAAGDGADKLTSVENVTGSAFDDKLVGNADANLLYGAAGDDTLFGLSGDDTLSGGAGTDTASYVYASGPVTVDLALGTATGDGTDTLISIEDLIGTSFADLIYGNDGANQLSGGTGSDEIHGGGGDDHLFGNDDADVLYGDGGTDVLRGGAGDDLLSGGAEGDWLFGEDGADVFAFADDVGRDTVGDYLDGIDWFDLSAQTGATEFADLSFTANAGGVLVDYGTGEFFVAGADIADFDSSDFFF
ncbi:beta strand repeat-containing protein [Propylenella binzhouense]|nr:calcium-binding protein [Propylenella binzhouense]